MNPPLSSDVVGLCDEAEMNVSLHDMGGEAVGHQEIATRIRTNGVLHQLMHRIPGFIVSETSSVSGKEGTSLLVADLINRVPVNNELYDGLEVSLSKEKVLTQNGILPLHKKVDGNMNVPTKDAVLSSTGVEEIKGKLDLGEAVLIRLGGDEFLATIKDEIGNYLGLFIDYKNMSAGNIGMSQRVDQILAAAPVLLEELVSINSELSLDNKIPPAKILNLFSDRLLANHRNHIFSGEIIPHVDTKEECKNELEKEQVKEEIQRRIEFSNKYAKERSIMRNLRAEGLENACSPVAFEEYLLWICNRLNISVPEEFGGIRLSDMDLFVRTGALQRIIAQDVAKHMPDELIMEASGVVMNFGTELSPERIAMGVQKGGHILVEKKMGNAKNIDPCVPQGIEDCVLDGNIQAEIDGFREKEEKYNVLLDSIADLLIQRQKIEGRFSRGDKNSVVRSARIRGHLATLKREERRMRSQDPVIDNAKVSRLNQCAHETFEQRRSLLGPAKFFLVEFDNDHFGSVNNPLGHESGDKVFDGGVAQTAQKYFRDSKDYVRPDGGRLRWLVLEDDFDPQKIPEIKTEASLNALVLILMETEYLKCTDVPQVMNEDPKIALGKLLSELRDYPEKWTPQLTRVFLEKGEQMALKKDLPNEKEKNKKLGRQWWQSHPGEISVEYSQEPIIVKPQDNYGEVLGARS